MPISGYFEDFSFPEVLRFIYVSHKTGHLQIRSLESGQLQTPYHLWFRNGDIVAVKHSRLSLQALLAQTCHQSIDIIEAAIEKVRSALTQPIGIVLKQQGIVQPEELQIIFNRQVLQPIVYQFTLDNAWFKFEVSSALPFEEMTGLSLSPIQAALNGLRRLKNWERLKSKLPEATSRLRRTSKSFSPYQLSSEEAYLWNLANEELSLLDSSIKLGLPVEETQKLAFRLIVTGLVDECPDTRSSNALHEAEIIAAEAESAPLGASFISNLIGFLKQRA